MQAPATVVAATVIRVAPSGFTAPYVLAAVRTADGVRLGQVETDPEALPAPGTGLEWLREEEGVQVYRPAAR